MRSRTEEFLKGTLSSILLQMIIMASGFIIPRVMMVVYGSEINGIVTSLTQFINYFTLIEAGLGGAAIFALYKPLASEDRPRINSILSASRNLYLRSGAIFLALVLVLAVVFPFFTKGSDLRYWEVLLLSVIIGMTGVLDFFTLSKYRVLLTADQRVYVVSLASAVYYVLYTAIIAFASFLSVSIVVIRAIAILAIFVRSLILVLYCRRRYRWIDFSVAPDYSAIEAKGDVLYQQICGMVQTGMPVILATLLLKDFAMVSVFTVYNMVLTGINGILGVFSTSLSSGFGNLVVQNDKPRLRNTYGEFEAAYQILITVAYTATLFLILPFVRLYTADVTDANYILPLFAMLAVWNGFFYNVKTPVSMLVVSAGMYRETRMQNTLTAAIIVVLGIPFTLLWGLEGIMIASILSNVYRTVDFVFFVHKHITEDSPRESIWRMVRALSCMTVATVLAVLLPLPIQSIGSWILWALLTTLAMGLSVIAALGIVDRAALRGLVMRLSRFVKKRG